MNIQKPILKPYAGQSLFALKKAGVSVKQNVTERPSVSSAVEVSSKIVPFSSSSTSVSRPSDEVALMSSSTVLMALQKKQKALKAKWRAPWKLHRVLQGHTGWVRSVDVDPSNEWFASGGNDRLIKVWDLASGVLRVTLTGHTHNIRAVRIHPQMKYLFSAGEDNMVKCWDLEQNKVIRHYHGHLSGVYCMDVHPSEHFLFTGSRDATVRMWDIRTRQCVHILGGHTNTVQCVASQSFAPELVSGSTDATVRLWDIRMGRSYTTLTHHKKGIRSISLNQETKQFASFAPDNVKVWREGEFERNISNSDGSILNCSAFREDGLLVGGSDTGSLSLWDWDSGALCQKIETPPQPGSLHCENGIFGMRFDMSGQRLITAECDKTVKIYREDETAVNPNIS